eukprot:TRINITY_DN5508_c0_g1_i2.p1 TRINITY_DN5508_c0_g1~~TRINITY_DN5508_c0_g1_i2.p1  ORF type:complete len:459 (+),score=58.77 TRINITY_DN5508_c0_g1_i2:41-1378(+)
MAFVSPPGSPASPGRLLGLGSAISGGLGSVDPTVRGICGATDAGTICMRGPGGSYTSQTHSTAYEVGLDGRIKDERFAESTVGDQIHNVRETQQAYANNLTGVRKAAVERQLGGQSHKVITESTRHGEVQHKELYSGMAQEDLARFEVRWKTQGQTVVPQHAPPAAAMMSPTGAMISNGSPSSPKTSPRLVTLGAVSPPGSPRLWHANGSTPGGVNRGFGAVLGPTYVVQHAQPQPSLVQPSSPVGSPRMWVAAPSPQVHPTSPVVSPRGMGWAASSPQAFPASSWTMSQPSPSPSSPGCGGWAGPGAWSNTFGQVAINHDRDIGPLESPGHVGLAPPTPQGPAENRHHWQKARDVVDVTLTKEGSLHGMFGLQHAVSADGMWLIISWIRPDGILAVWNSMYPEKAVEVGDRIISVNGHQDIAEMRLQMTVDTVVLMVQRVHKHE